MNNLFERQLEEAMYDLWEEEREYKPLPTFLSQEEREESKKHDIQWLDEEELI